MASEWRPKLFMPMSKFIGIAVADIMNGALLVNDESGGHSTRYLDVGGGLKIHMSVDVYNAILDLVADKCKREIIRPCVGVWKWQRK